MSRTLFITGTGTDIGKTVLALSVVLWARARGLAVAYMKPVQCGSRRTGAGVYGDAEWIADLCPDRIEAGTVYTFASAVSPHLAAEQDGAWVDAEWIGEQAALVSRRCDLLVVEGAGGAAVPLDREGNTLADVAAAQGWPCLVGAAPGLGTLHHTLTTAHFLRTRGAEPMGFAFIQATPETSPLARDNAAMLESLLKIPHVGTVPYCPGLGRHVPVPPAVCSLLSESLPGLDAWWASA